MQIQLLFLSNTIVDLMWESSADKIECSRGKKRSVFPGEYRWVPARIGVVWQRSIW